MVDARQIETLGPAERILQTLLTYSDHLYHNRPGMVTADGRTSTGVRWAPVTHKEEDGKKIVYRLDKVGRRTNRVKVGELREDGTIVGDNGREAGHYRPAGIFPEVAAWMYAKVAEVWELDNEFSARWASYAFRQEHRDLKVILSAFMLVQSRKGEPIKDEGETFFDEDYRDVGEAMMLLREDKRDLNPKQLLRIRELLTLPRIAEINRDLGFGKSARTPFLGRWPKAVEKWLLYREQNPQMLEGLVKAGFRTTVMDLARAVGYKPESAKFFEILRWKQKQSSDGRRAIAIGAEVKAAESWQGLGEMEICSTIENTKPNWKRIVGLLPSSVGVTRAILAAAIESECLSDKDLIIQTPTLEELGLLKVESIKARWDRAVQRAEDQRAANIAKNVRSKVTREKLQEAADEALKGAVEEVARGIRTYVFVDTSASMSNAIDAAKTYLTQFLQGFPVDQLHVATFNTTGREVNITRPTAAGVAQAFRGRRAGGGTDHGSGVKALAKYKPKDDEDVLFLFVGDEQQWGTFTQVVQNSGLNPMAFGLVKVADPNFGRPGTCIQDTAQALGIPCFMIEPDTFADPYAVTRTIRNLIAATPVREGRAVPQARPRVTLVETILNTDLLKKPAWAA